MVGPIALIAGGVAAAYAAVDKYRRAGSAWTVDGLLSVIGIAGNVETIATMTGASRTSMYRDAQAQIDIYNNKRKDPAQWAVVESSARAAGKTTEAYVAGLAGGSRHNRGLAADFWRKDIDQLWNEIADLAVSGRVGPVKKVLNERDHVHVEWYGVGETIRPPVKEKV